MRPLTKSSFSLIQILQDKPLLRSYGTITDPIQVEEPEEKDNSDSEELREKIEYLELQLQLKDQV